MISHWQRSASGFFNRKILSTPCGTKGPADKGARRNGMTPLKRSAAGETLVRIKFIFLKSPEYVVRKFSKWINMKNQVKVGKSGTERRVVIRSYQSKFSCMEVVERLIQIHSAVSEQADRMNPIYNAVREEAVGKEKSQISST